MLNQTTFAKLLNNLKKISTSNMEEKTRGGAPYVINIAGVNRKLEIIYTTIHSRKGTWND